MQFSEKSKQHMDQCRFCWMCRHICPIGNATGQERNTARARGMVLALVARGGVDYTPDIADNVYECALCGACVKECVTGWDPVSFVKEARLAAALDGKMPSYVSDMIEKIEKTGNVYGIKDVEKKLASAISAHKKKTDTLLFLGKDAIYKSPDNAINAIKVLEKADVSFSVLTDEPDSAYAYDFLIGAAEETRQTAKKCAAVLDGYKTVICYDSADAKMFLREYKEWGISTKANVVTFTSYLAALTDDKKLGKKGRKEYTFQDPVHLARDLEETECARKIIGASGKNKEMLLFGKDTMLAGNLIMNEYMPEVMKKVSENRWENAKNVGAKTLVCASVADYEVLKSVKPDGIDLIMIEEVLL